MYLLKTTSAIQLCSQVHVLRITILLLRLYIWINHCLFLYIKARPPHEINLAMGRPVWQSSGDDLAPSRANDGNFDPRLEYGSCIRTQSSHLRPWWAVDLGSSYRISHVLVTTRNMRSMYNNGVVTINSSPPGQNGRHFSDEIFRCIFVNVKFCILIKISLKLVPNGPIYNSPVLV